MLARARKIYEEQGAEYYKEWMAALSDDERAQLEQETSELVERSLRAYSDAMEAIVPAVETAMRVFSEWATGIIDRHHRQSSRSSGHPIGVLICTPRPATACLGPSRGSFWLSREFQNKPY